MTPKLPSRVRGMIEVMRDRRRVELDPYLERARRYIQPSARPFSESTDIRYTPDILDNYTETMSDLFAASVAGLMCPSSSEWFELSLEAPTRSEQVWLKRATDLTRRVIGSHDSRFNTTAGQTIKTLGDFGTAPVQLLDVPGRVLRFISLPLQQTWIELDDVGDLAAIARSWKWSPVQCVARWGDRAGEKTIDASKKDSAQVPYIECLQLIADRENYNLNVSGAGSRRFVSIEINGDEELIARKGSYEVMPVIAPRWTVQPGDAYGRAPGLVAAGDVDTLQRATEGIIDAVEISNRPPLQVPDDGLTAPLDRGPEAINLIRSDLFLGTSPPIAPLPIGESPQLAEGLADRIRDNIASAYYMPWIQPPTDEKLGEMQVMKIEAYRMQTLGRALSRFHAEHHDPVIRHIVRWLIKEKLLDRPRSFDPAREKIDNREFNITYLSPLQRGQRLSEVNLVAQWVELVTRLAAIDPAAADVIDTDSIPRGMATMMGIDPSQLRNKRTVAQMREARSEAQQRAQATEEMATRAKAAQSFAQAQTVGVGGRPPNPQTGI